VIPAFLITLREGLEAALIVGIVAAYLVRVDRRDALPKVWIGVFSAIALSVIVGVAVIATIGRLPLIVQETLEGVAALLAVAVLTWMLFWMRRQGRALKGDLERGVDLALANGSVLALAGLAFVSVAREGLETVLFMAAVVSSSTVGIGPAIGAIAGLGLAVLIGWAFFVAGVRIDLRRFFSITGVLLIFVAAGLCGFAVHEFGEARLIQNSGAVFDLSAVLPETNPIGAVLAGLFGYRSSPTALELIAYLGYLIPIVILFVAGDRQRPAPRPNRADAEA
jgi:high-affinity iron transporter